MEIKKKHRTRIFTFAVVLITTVTVFLSACDFQESLLGPKQENSIPQRSVSTSINIPEQSVLSQQQFQIYSSLDSKTAQVDSNVVLNTVKGSKQQILVIASEGGNPVLLTTISDTTSGATKVASAESTAKSLVLMNPFFLGTSHAQRELILNRANSHEEFIKLTKDIETLLIEDPENTLDYQSHPGIYKTAVSIATDILKETAKMESLTIPNSEEPWIEDIKGDPFIAFYNPRSIYYGVGIDNQMETGLEDVITLSAKSSHLKVKLEWPPIVRTDPTISKYELGDGNFKIEITKGFDFSDNEGFKLGTPNTRATISNLGKGILLTFDLLTGFDIVPTEPMSELIIDSPENAVFITQLSKHMSEGDGINIFLDILKLIKSNKNLISVWLWESASSVVAENYISQISKILVNVNTAVKVLTFAQTGLNEAVPFISDLINAKGTTTISLTQENGNITENKKNRAPTKPTINTESADVNVGEIINFSVSSGDPDGENVSYRLKLGSNQYSEWSNYMPSGSVYEFSYAYQQEGERVVTAEAKDESGAISELSEPIHVRIYRENVFFSEDFEDEIIGQLPSNPPWTIDQQDPSYLQVIQDAYSTNLTTAFYDYDPVIDTDSATSHAAIYTTIESNNKGFVEFSWKVKSANDNFGLRVWENFGDWDEMMGYYVLFYEGALSYYHNGEFRRIMETNPNTWYNMKIEYSQDLLSYNIYVNGNLMETDIEFVGTPTSLNIFQVLAFSDAQCRTGYIDDIKMSGASPLKIQPKIFYEKTEKVTTISNHR